MRSAGNQALATDVVATATSTRAAEAKETSMRRPIYTAAILLVVAALTGIVMRRSDAQDATATKRYLPEYTESGELILPKGFEKWVYVGSPLTPNVLNGGKANFPEFHNVYIEPGSYDIYQKTGVFPEGTILLKELAADASRRES